jgi:spore maturation protein CgeB
VENLIFNPAMSKVLIIGSNYFTFNESVKRAFENLGWVTHVEGYDTPIHPFNRMMKWRRKFSLNRQKLQQEQDTKFNRYIVDVFKHEQPDLVFILNGDILFPETLDFFRTASKVALWMYDTLARYPRSREHIGHTDAFFCYEMNDVENYHKQGKTAYFLPQACDEKEYYPLKERKDIDILFVGVLYGYNKRIKLLKAVTEKFPDKKILIAGKYKPIEKNPFKWLFREKRHIFTNENIAPEEVNQLYNRAKTVLNIHHETQQCGANPKVFEISGAGAYQICDANQFIEQLFPNSEIGLYRNEKELIDNIDYALKHDVSEKALQAMQIVLNNHTFYHRIKYVLDIIYNNVTK